MRVASFAFNGEGTDAEIYPDSQIPPSSPPWNKRKPALTGSATPRPPGSQSPRTAGETTLALEQNHAIATTLGVCYNLDSLVQPDVSGLYSSVFQQAAYDFGIRYLISDASRSGWEYPSFNAGFYSTYQPSILIIPRHASNLFYNVTNPTEWISEYNWFYAPGGQRPYFSHDLNYAEPLDFESDFWLDFLLTWDIHRVTFHQSNLRAYDGTHSLFGDLVEQTLARYHSIYTLPIASPSMHDLGTAMAHRMTYDASGASAQIAACQAITLTTTNAASIPVTGITYGANTEVYGGQPISYGDLAAGATAVLPAPACTAPVAVAGNDQTTTIGSSVQLDGSLSHDTHDSLPLTYGWQQTGGTPVTLSSRTASRPTFTAPAQATVITLTLTGDRHLQPGQRTRPDPDHRRRHRTGKPGGDDQQPDSPGP